MFCARAWWGNGRTGGDVLLQPADTRFDRVKTLLEHAQSPIETARVLRCTIASRDTRHHSNNRTQHHKHQQIRLLREIHDCPLPRDMQLFSTLVISTASQQLLLWAVKNEGERYEEKAGLHFCGTAIVFSIGISGELSFAVLGATAGDHQGLPGRPWSKQRTM